MAADFNGVYPCKYHQFFGAIILDVLQEICAYKLQFVEERKKTVSLEQIRTLAKHGDTRNFFDALQNKVKNKQNALIAEVKKASPSKGVIRSDFNPADIAIAYEKGGAACISVLTDEKYFQGSDENLKIIKQASNLPVLRKDFILDPYQIYEAKAIGADCILLIMAALTDNMATELENVAIDLGLDVLIEVHNEEELERALLLKTKLTGINNRNLKTLSVDITTTGKLVKNIPAGYLVVCESGINNHKDILQVNEYGVYCFLVGESLMRQQNVEMATKALLNVN